MCRIQEAVWKNMSTEHGEPPAEPPCLPAQVLRQFISRRGNVMMIRSDNGTNFVGASIELRKAFGEIHEKRINDFLMELGGEWISWKHNRPMASNMGGVWEWQI